MNCIIIIPPFVHDPTISFEMNFSIDVVNVRSMQGFKQRSNAENKGLYQRDSQKFLTLININWKTF